MFRKSTVFALSGSVALAFLCGHPAGAIAIFYGSFYSNSQCQLDVVQVDEGAAPTAASVEKPVAALARLDFGASTVETASVVINLSSPGLRLASGAAANALDSDGPGPDAGFSPLYMEEDDYDYTITLTADIVSLVTELDAAGRAIEAAGGDADAAALADIGLTPAGTLSSTINSDIFNLSTQPIEFETTESDTSIAEHALSDADNLNDMHLRYGGRSRSHRSAMPQVMP